VRLEPEIPAGRERLDELERAIAGVERLSSVAPLVAGTLA
jgi:hypothetical protein